MLCVPYHAAAELKSRGAPSAKTGRGVAPSGGPGGGGPGGGGLHSFPFQLNLSSSVHRISHLNS